MRDPSAAGTPSSPQPALTIVSPDGEDRGTVTLAAEPVRIGRLPGNDIVLDSDVDQIVSRKHCVVEPDGPRWRVRDLGSRNHTYIERGGLRAEVDQSELLHGDAICLRADRAGEPAGGEIRYWRLAFTDPGETQLASAGRWLQYYPGRETVWLLGGPQLSQLFDAPPKPRRMLLHLLARHRELGEPRDGVLATLTELKPVLWPRDEDPLHHDDGAVAHVAWQLRTALGDDEQRLLQTEKSLGYRLVPRP